MVGASRYWDDRAEATAPRRLQRLQRNRRQPGRSWPVNLALLALIGLVLWQTWLLRRDLEHLIRLVESLRVMPAAAAVAYPGSEATNPADRGHAVLAAGRLTLTVVDRPAAPDLVLWVNNHKVADFAAGTLTVRVQPGAEIALSSETRRPGRIRVVASDGWARALLGREVVVEGPPALLTGGGGGPK